MATCGHCGQAGQTVAHVRTCGQAGAVATTTLPQLVIGNVVTLVDEPGFWTVEHLATHEDGVPWLGAEQIRSENGSGKAHRVAPTSEVELVFPDMQAAANYRIAVDTEVAKAQVRETLHGDPSYCRGCAKGWAAAKWHRDGCPNIAQVALPVRDTGTHVDEMVDVPGLPGVRVPAPVDGNPWAPVNELRNRIKPYLHRKIRNATIGHFAARTDGSDVVKFYRVKLVTAGNWAGKVFVEAQASDDYYPIKTPATLTMVLTAILVNPKAAEELYGRELGQCYRCNRTLTDETSRRLGIGPECRSKL